MVVDSSAVIALILDEPGVDALRVRLRRARRLRISAATYLESCVVMTRRHGASSVDRVDELLTLYAITIAWVTNRQARGARGAFVRFGKGRHPAALNFGDCFSYALAKTRDEPLLFVGDDFARTDVRRALN